MVVFGQKWLYSGKRGCFRANRLFSVKSAFIRAKFLYSGELVPFRAKVVVFGLSGYIQKE